MFLKTQGNKQTNKQTKQTPQQTKKRKQTPQQKKTKNNNTTNKQNKHLNKQTKQSILLITYVDKPYEILLVKFGFLNFSIYLNTKVC